MRLSLIALSLREKIDFMAIELTPDSLPIGDISLLEREHKTAFLCSRGMAEVGRLAIKAWLESLNPEVDCVMCGNIQKVERDVLDALVRRGIPAVLVLDGPFPPMWPRNLVQAIGDRKLLAVTTSFFFVPWVDKYGMAEARNRYMIANAETVALGFCRPGGQIEKQLQGVNVNVKVLNPYSPMLEYSARNKGGYTAGVPMAQQTTAQAPDTAVQQAAEAPTEYNAKTKGAE